MRLQIVTPLSVVVDAEIDSLRAEDTSGSFGIMAGHAPFLTALVTSIVSWRSGGQEQYCAVRGGTLRVDRKTGIAIATREAVLGDDLATLDAEVLARFRAELDAERVENVESMRLQLDVIRRMINRQHAGADLGAFR